MIEQYNDYYFLRLDKQNTLGVFGDKARLAFELSKNENGIVTCGSRESIQTVAFAKICDELKLPCIIHIPQGKDTDSIIELNKTSCNIVREKVGYNNVLNAHAKQHAETLGYKFIKLGMLCNEAYDLIADNIKYILPFINQINRIVVPVGSGTTLIGLIKGLQNQHIDIPVIGIMCGMDASKNIYNEIKYDNLTLFKSNTKYHNKTYNRFCNIELNPYYEAKCIPYLQSKDLLYIVSK